jgi:Protein of unknown function (DUF4197)
MKSMILKSSLVLAGFMSLQSCESMAGSAMNGVIKSVANADFIKNALNGGIGKAMGIFSNPKEFLTNALVEAAIPKELKDINQKLTNIGLTSIVDKEKSYIADAAKMSVTEAQPLLLDAVQKMTAADAVQIIQGGTGAATKYLREKTEAALTAKIQPKVDAKINESGVMKSINSLGNGGGITDMLGGLLGGGQQNPQQSVSNYATKQLVNSVYSIVDSQAK